MNEYIDKVKKLEERTVVFSVSLIKQVGPYSKVISLRPVIDQIIRSATSIGANYAEANNSSSRADFKNKVYIAKKEAAETRYWLRILTELLPAEDFAKLQQEAHELNMIMQKITSTMKDGTTNG